MVDSERRSLCVAYGRMYLGDVIDEVLLATVRSLVTFQAPLPPVFQGAASGIVGGSRVTSFPLPVPDMPPALASMFSIAVADWSRLCAIEVAASSHGTLFPIPVT